MLNNEGNEGNVGKHTPVGEFAFDAEVSKIFDNMAIRSIPMYESANRLLAQLVASNLFNKKDKPYRILDIGASSGNFLAEVLRAVVGEVSQPPEWLRLFAEDNSPHMIQELTKKLPWVHKTRRDVLSPQYHITQSNYSVISMMYLLQFLPEHQRLPLIRRAHAGLTSKGMLIIGQKTITGNQAMDAHIEQIYHTWRMSNGYTVDEIYHKSTALQKVMTPNTSQQTLDMLEMAGFRLEQVTELTKFMGFSTLVAFKD